MRPPTIAIVQRGYTDRYGRQRLYLRYAWNFQTNYIVLPWRLLPKDWDPVAQTVKSRATLGGETALTVNGDLAKTMNKAYAIIAEMTTADIPPSFEEFRMRMNAGKKVARHFAESARELLQQELDANEIAYRTFNTYRAAVNKFEETMGKLSIQELSRENVLDFKRKLVMAGKENLANQYIRYLKIMYGRVLKYFNLKDVRKPFDSVDIKVVKISDKKSLSLDEYAIFRKALTQAKPGSKEFETLRRFLIMCRGLRYSDTQHIKKEDHYFEMKDGDTMYRYLIDHRCPENREQRNRSHFGRRRPTTPPMAPGWLPFQETQLPNLQQLAPQDQPRPHRPGNHLALRPALHRRFHPEQRRYGDRRRQKNPGRKKRPDRGNLCAKGYQGGVEEVL